MHFILIHAFAQDIDNYDIDHISIVVNDLDEAKSSFRNLGFTIKDGSKHENSIENAHMKFLDGTALELITATETKDDLAGVYMEQKAKGDGPVFLCLNMSDIDSAQSLLSDYKPILIVGKYYQWLTFPDETAINYLFLIKYSRPPVDRKELLYHQNNVLGIKEINLNKPDFEKGKAIFSKLGFIANQENKIKIHEKLISMEQSIQPNKNRFMTSITLWVEDIHETLQQLPKGIPFHFSKDNVITIPPEYSHGIEIRFEQKL